MPSIIIIGKRWPVICGIIHRLIYQPTLHLTQSLAHIVSVEAFIDRSVDCRWKILYDRNDY